MVINNAPCMILIIFFFLGDIQGHPNRNRRQNVHPAAIQDEIKQVEESDLQDIPIAGDLISTVKKPFENKVTSQGGGLPSIPGLPSLPFGGGTGVEGAGSSVGPMAIFGGFTAFVMPLAGMGNLLSGIPSFLAQLPSLSSTNFPALPTISPITG